MEEPDVVVVGGGPCGALAARELIRCGRTVTMLDSGVAAPRGVVIRAAGNTVFRRMGGSMLTDRHVASGDPRTQWHSSMSLGGLSNYWTGSVPRYAPGDFTEGASLDERYEWPVTYEELIPHYEAAELALLVTAGDELGNVPAGLKAFHHRLPGDWAEVTARATEAGHGMAALPMAKGRPWMVALRGTEFNSYHCIVKPLLAAPGFRLVSGAHALGVRWSAGVGGADGVEYLDRATKQRCVLRARAVILAAGALDSTMLLLRSTSPDFPDGLGNTSGLLGKYLHDHPREWWPAELARPMEALSHPVYLARGPYDADHPLLAAGMTLGLASRSDRLRTYVRGMTTQIGVQVFGTMIPTADSGVTLAAEQRDRGPDAKLDIDIRYDPDARSTIQAARQRFREVLADAGLGTKALGPFHELHPGSSVHYGGTVRMHRSPEYGVLDGWNRMHDVPNVVVCDASCFTTGPEKNPTLTAMAIAVRAAGRLAGDLA